MEVASNKCQTYAYTPHVKDRVRTTFHQCDRTVMTILCKNCRFVDRDNASLTRLWLGEAWQRHCLQRQPYEQFQISMCCSRVQLIRPGACTALSTWLWPAAKWSIKHTACDWPTVPCMLYFMLSTPMPQAIALRHWCPLQVPALVSSAPLLSRICLAMFLVDEVKRHGEAQHACTLCSAYDVSTKTAVKQMHNAQQIAYIEPAQLVNADPHTLSRLNRAYSTLPYP